jgi:hypothetical protein
MKPRALTARSLRRATTGAVAPHAIPTRGGVGGQVPPTSVHTQGNLLRNGPDSSGSAAPTRAARDRGDDPKTWVRRHRHGRPQQKGWASWVAEVAEELRARGGVELAHNLRSCGSTARVRECSACGDALGSVEVRASCGLRVCPWCAKIAAREKVALVGGAVDRVEGYQRAQAKAAAARVEEERATAAAAVDHWLRLEGAARAAGRSAVADRHEERARAAAARVALARREARAVAELGRWSWKLVTFSPAWSPQDGREYTVAGLRRRVARCWAAWSRVWEAGARAGGLAAATLRVEVSSRGHVHLHVLYRGPWVAQSWWARVSGCMVDVRAVDDFGGIVEVVKYSLKMPTPSRAEWIAGDARSVPHPALAASWLLATRRVQLLRHVGVMRDAISAEEAAGEDMREEEPSAVCGCASCGADLSGVQVVLVATRVVARALGPRWGATATVDLWGRVLPRRVSIVRAPW